MVKRALSRRTFLKGMLGGTAVSVALPPLEAMFNLCGSAYADGQTIPTRFGVWFWGNGVRPEHWVPSTTGLNWSPSAELAPLVDGGLRDHFSVVTGCNIKTGTHPHHSGMTGIMTGSPLYKIGDVRDTIASTFAGQSVDQIAADTLGASTAFRSLEVGITHFRGTDEGTTFQHLSHNGPNNPNPSEYNPRNLFSRLFATPLEPQLNLARTSVLDAVTDQIRTLQRDVGSNDKARLEQHFQSIRTLEQRLQSDPTACARPALPNTHPDIEGREQIAPKNQVMSELIALALACDLTRVFSVQFSTAGSGVIVWQVGAQNSLHQTCHDESLPQPTVHAATLFTMEQLAGFLNILRETPEGDGTLLDHCSILCTSELADGYTHSNAEFPLILAGRGSGRLRGGLHHRAVDENATKVALTALRGAGVEAASFGTEAGRVTETLSALES